MVNDRDSVTPVIEQLLDNPDLLKSQVAFNFNYISEYLDPFLGVYSSKKGALIKRFLSQLHGE